MLRGRRRALREPFWLLSPGWCTPPRDPFFDFRVLFCFFGGAAARDLQLQEPVVGPAGLLIRPLRDQRTRDIIHVGQHAERVDLNQQPSDQSRVVDSVPFKGHDTMVSRCKI